MVSCAAWLMQVELVGLLLLLALAPRRWEADRDAILAWHHTRFGVLWLWKALAWPTQTFRTVYSTSARLSAVPISGLISHRDPWTSVVCSALVYPMTYATLLLQAHDCGDSHGLDGALFQSMHARSGLLVVGGLAFCALNLLWALLCSVAVEVWVRRAWVRSQAAGPASPSLPRQQAVDARVCAAGASWAPALPASALRQ
jgi:hypothetical protein